MEELQWVVTCSNCDASVEYNCNTCEVPLCTPCMKKHKNCGDSKHHRIVTYSERKKPVIRYCEEHPGSTLQTWCDSCNSAVCINCMTSSCHRGHGFVNFEEKLSGKREVLQLEYEKSVVSCSDCTKSIADLEMKRRTIEHSFDDIDIKIEAHADKVKREVNRLKDEKRKELQEHKEACLQNMNSERDSLQQNLRKSENRRDGYENILRSNDMVAILEFKPSLTVVNENKASYQLLKPRIPAFTEGAIDVSQLETMFGRLTFAEARHHGKSKSVKEKGTMGPYENYHSIPRRNTMPSSRMESYALKTGWSAPSPIVCVGHGQTWIATHKKILRILDKEGNSSGRKDVDFIFCDAAVAPNDDIILLDNNKNCVRSLLRSGSCSTLFSLSLKPYGICPLYNGDFIITFRDEGKVIKYKNSGVLLMQFGQLGLHRPWNVAQNRANKLVHIIDKTGYGYYKDPGRVVTCTENGQFVKSYTAAGHEDSVFAPVDVCTDEHGHIFITDYSSHTVHILNKDGVFKRFLDVNERETLMNPCRIDINDSMYVWISENETEKVKVIRYI